MTNAYYNPTGTPAQNSQGLSSPMRAEFSAIGRGFDALPTITTTGSFNTVFAQQAVVTLTLPPYNGTLATLDGAETLTNKTLASPAITGVANAPTAAPGTNTPQVATTAFATAADNVVAANSSAAVAAETTRATAAEAANASAITAETSRAMAAEAALTSPLPSLTVTGILGVGTSGQFYLNPSLGGNPTLNFANNNFIDYVSGFGLELHSPGGNILIDASAFDVLAALSVTGSMAVSGNAQVNGTLGIGSGTTGLSLNPNSGGNQVITFGGAGQYIQFVPGTGFQWATGGAIQITAPSGVTVNGQPVAVNFSSPTFSDVGCNNLTVTAATTLNNLHTNGVITVSGQTTLTGNSYYFTSTSGGLVQTAWSFGIGINCATGNNGVVAAGFFTNSDARLKTDVEEIGADEAIGWIKRGRPVRFKWLDGGKPTAGFIAQDELANDRDGGSIIQASDSRQRFAAGGDGAEPGKRLEKDYSHEIPYLTKALQAALARIEALEARLK